MPVQRRRWNEGLRWSRRRRLRPERAGRAGRSRRGSSVPQPGFNDRERHSTIEALVSLEIAFDGRVDFTVLVPVNENQAARTDQQLFQYFQRLVENSFQ